MAGAASTGHSTRGMSAGFGNPHNPVQPITQKPLDPNAILANMDPKIAATLPEANMNMPNASQTVSESRTAVSTQIQGLRFPELPETSEEGTAEVCLVTKDKYAQYSHVWYGTEEERESVRKVILDWANEMKADTVIFFKAHEWYYQPKQVLKRGGIEVEKE